MINKISICLPACLSVGLYVFMLVCFPVCIFPVCLFLSVSLSVCWSFFRSVYISVFKVGQALVFGGRRGLVVSCRLPV